MEPHRTRLILLAFLGTALLLSASCTTMLETGAALMETGSARKEKSAVILQTSYGAAEMLSQQAGRQLSRTMPIQVRPLVSTAAPDESTGFGQIVADQIAARLAQLGYTVVGGDNTAPAITVGGSYAAARDEVLVHLVMAKQPGGNAISALDYTVPLTRDVRDLIKTEAQKKSPFDY